jgi:hypothetical protein
MVVVVVALFDPRARDRGELGSAIGLLDVDEPGTLEQVAVGSVGGDGDGAIAVGAASLAGRESACGVDREEGGTPVRAEEVSGCSQHGELCPQSTQHVGVHYRVEAARREGQGASARRHRRHLLGRVVGLGAGERLS